MKRKTKNIIIITLIIILGITSGFTIKLAKDSVSTNSKNVGQNMGTPPDKPDDSNGMPTENMQSQSRKEIDIEYYILFGVEAFLISLLIAFLIMSNFNKKTIAMTLSGAKNIVILVLIVAILTAVLTVTQAFIANKLIETNQTQSQSGMQAPNGMQMPGGNGETSSNVTYTASKEITEDTTINSGEYSSTTADENALLASGDINVSVSNVNVTKTGDSDGRDSSNFYGNNSAVLAKDGANLTLDNIIVTTDADGANGVFSYGGSATTNNSSTDGTTVIISNSSITTTGDNAGGIMTTGDGTTNASNLTINTSGTSSAAIRSDRGGGTINGENEAKSITLKLDSTSKIKLTGDSYVTSLEDADATYSNIDFNGYKLYVNGVAIN